MGDVRGIIVPHHKLVPIIFKQGAPRQQLDLLINRIAQFDLQDTVL